MERQILVAVAWADIIAQVAFRVLRIAGCVLIGILISRWIWRYRA